MNATIPFLRAIRHLSSRWIALVFISMAVLSLDGVIAGQSSTKSISGDAVGSLIDDDSIVGQTSPIAEMIAKRRIKLEEKEHQETVDRATEASKLGNELVETFQKTQRLGQQDFKKIDRIEKLVKKIRDAFGGTGEDVEMEDAPHDLSSAIRKVRDLSCDLQDRIEKTSRMELSAAVVERTNELLEVIKMLRSMRNGNA